MERDQLLTILNEALANRTTVDIIYNGGSKPGAIRSVYPLELTYSSMRARPAMERIVKEYKLDKVLIWDGKEIPVIVKTLEQQILEITSIQEFIDKFMDRFEHIDGVLKYDHKCIQLYDYTKKRDRLYKQPSIEVVYDPETYDVKPWCIYGMRYKVLGKALLEFYKRVIR